MLGHGAIAEFALGEVEAVTTPTPGGGGIIVHVRDYARERETEDERRARIFAEMEDRLREGLDAPAPEKVVEEVAETAQGSLGAAPSTTLVRRFTAALDRAQHAAQEAERLRQQQEAARLAGLLHDFYSRLAQEQAELAAIQYARNQEALALLLTEA